MPILTLIRGLPGSGKSTFAKSGWYGLHMEADLFFERPQGGSFVYDYDHTLIKVAHEWCYASTVKALRCGSDVVVSNTFTTMWEMQRYLDLPELISNLRIRLVEMHTQYGSVHDVPQTAIDKMKQRWEALPVDFPWPVDYIDDEFDNVVRERDSLRKQLETLKQEVNRLRWAIEEHD